MDADMREATVPTIPTVIVLGVLIGLAIVIIVKFAKQKQKENYGEPPGTVRALDADELGQRGWADSPPLFVSGPSKPDAPCCWDLKQGRQARSASGILASVERTA